VSVVWKSWRKSGQSELRGEGEKHRFITGQWEGVPRTALLWVNIGVFAGHTSPNRGP
jgi:hypothetical protein